MAIANGLLTETHFVDIKRELPPPRKNEDISIDLAAFSIDGGTIFVGVDEKIVPPSIHPISLHGLGERIEQIGLNVDPPVKVRTYSIQIESSQGSGVLVIVIPPSPNAPHMVKGQYRARNDKTNYVMADAEVRRIRDELDDHLEEIDELLEDFARTAIPTHSGDGPLLLVVARPVSARAEMLLTCAGPDPFDWINRELLRGPLSERLTPLWGPDFLDGLPIVPRANGWGITRSSVPELDLEIHEDGVLRLRAGQLEVQQGFPILVTVNDVAINGLVKRVVLAAAQIGRGCSHFGSWDFAVSITALKGKRSLMGRQIRAIAQSHGRVLYEMPAYSEDVYHQTASATYEELAEDPNAIVSMLLGRLNRAFAGPDATIPS
jgi:hypothetical protein